MELSKYLIFVLQETDKNLFTYSNDFNSATFVPVNCDELNREEHLKSRQKWRDSQDFIYPGVKTSRESNCCRKKPTPNRLDELQKVRFIIKQIRSLLKLSIYC